jgi:hypothetical protein
MQKEGPSTRAQRSLLDGMNPCSIMGQFMVQGYVHVTYLAMVDRRVSHRSRAVHIPV